MAWLAQLAKQISKQTNTNVTVIKLYSQFVRFRKDCSDPILKKSYPSDIRYFKTGSTPHASTKDIILSFMDRFYPDVHVPIVAELASFLDGAARKAREPSELEKVISKEHLRRFQSSSESSYWGLNQIRMTEKYAGLFSLVRMDSNKELQCDPFALVLRPENPTMVSVYWLYGDRLRVGDLIVNSYRLSGLTVWRSTDAVIEPAPISLLRAARGVQKSLKMPLVLGGYGVVWKDTDPHALYHCRLALVKLAFDSKIENYGSFLELAKSREVRATLKRLKEFTEVRDNLLPNFINKTDLGMKSTDARDALPGLSRGLLRVRRLRENRRAH